MSGVESPNSIPAAQVVALLAAERERLRVFDLHLTSSQKEKLDRLGGPAWIAERIDMAGHEVEFVWDAPP